jgi:hypothetical protein
MKRLSIKPNAQIYSFIVDYFTVNDNLEMAIQYLFAMKSQDIVPELSAVQGVVILAAENGYARLALDIIADFEKLSRRRVGDEVWIACLYSAANVFYVSLCITNLSHNTHHYADGWRRPMLEGCC